MGKQQRKSACREATAYFHTVPHSLPDTDTVRVSHGMQDFGPPRGTACAWRNDACHRGDSKPEPAPAEEQRQAAQEFRSTRKPTARELLAFLTERRLVHGLSVDDSCFSITLSADVEPPERCRSSLPWPATYRPSAWRGSRLGRRFSRPFV